MVLAAFSATIFSSPLFKVAETLETSMGSANSMRL